MSTVDITAPIVSSDYTVNKVILPRILSVVPCKSYNELWNFKYLSEDDLALIISKVSAGLTSSPYGCLSYSIHMLDKGLVIKVPKVGTDCYKNMYKASARRMESDYSFMKRCRKALFF